MAMETLHFKGFSGYEILSEHAASVKVLAQANHLAVKKYNIWWRLSRAAVYQIETGQGNQSWPDDHFTCREKNDTQIMIDHFLY